MTIPDISLKGVRRDTKRFTREARIIVAEVHQRLINELPFYAKMQLEYPTELETIKQIMTRQVVAIAFLLNTSPGELAARTKIIENSSLRILWRWIRKYPEFNYATHYDRNSVRKITKVLIESLNLTPEESIFIVRLATFRGISDEDPFAVVEEY